MLLQNFLKFTHHKKYKFWIYFLFVSCITVSRKYIYLKFYSQVRVHFFAQKIIEILDLP